MRFLYLSVIFFFCLNVSAQHKINFQIDHYENDTLIIGYYMGDRQLVLDTLLSENQKEFTLQGEDTLKVGYYLALMMPNKSYFQFLVDEDQEFKFMADYTDLSKLSVKGSNDNKMFIDYIDMLNELKPEAALLRTAIDSSVVESEKKSFEQKLDELDLKVTQKQENILNEYPNSLTGLLIKANREISIPEFEGTEQEVKTKRYLHYRGNYFEHFDLGNPNLIHTPFFHERVNYFINKLTVGVPDSIIQAVDFILEEVEPAQESYRFYLSYFLNQYAKSKIVGMDKVYVHLVDKYYSQGKADWVSEENLAKIVKNAEDLRPVLIGKTGENLTLYKEDGTPITLDSLDYEYLVLFFWAPECGHCKKAIPKIIEFNEKYKDQGVTLLSICTKHGDKTKSCWESVKEKKIEHFLNVADQYHKSKFKIKYNVKSTPKIYVLDKERKILMKDIGADQLGNVIDKISEMEKMEEENN